MIDCSHGNSRKNYKNQSVVLNDILIQKLMGNDSIFGLMLESNINEGKQELRPDLQYGISITDSCINLQETELLLTKFNQALNNK